MIKHFIDAHGVFNGLASSLRRFRMTTRRGYAARALVSLVAFFCLLTGHWSLVTGHCFAAVPHLIRYQGQAVDAQGVPLEGPYTLTFRLYDAETAGAKVWEEAQPNVPLTNGHFSVLLGQVTPLTADWSVPLWLALQVGTDPELAPRQPITSVPLALLAEQLDGPLHIAGQQVGIGTTSPNARLGVAGTIQVSAAGAPPSGGTGLELRGGSNGSIRAWNRSDNTPLALSLDAGNYDFGIKNVAGKVVIDGSGNVGIGTVAPSSRLTIKPSDNEPQLRLEQDNAVDGWTFFADSGGGPLRISRVGADRAGEKLQISADGNVGIGTTSPTRRLEVASDGSSWISGTFSRYSGDDKVVLGNINGRGTIGAHNAGLSAWTPLAVNTDGNAAGGDVIMGIGSSNVGIGTTSPQYKLDVAGAAHASSFPTSSDLRLKTHITPLTNVLSRLEQIHGVEFDWNETYKMMGRSTGHREVGLIAQEVEAAFPGLVTRWGEEGYRAVDYGRLTAVLLEAVKELRQQVSVLNAQHEALVERVKQLEQSTPQDHAAE